MKINKKYHFYAAHRNHAGGEKCGRIHGHTYDVECTFEFQEMNEGGVTMLFSDIDSIVEPIIKSFCHWFLIYDKDPLVELLELANEPIHKLPFETSAENMAIWIFNLIKKELPIVKITLGETKSSVIEYEPR